MNPKFYKENDKNKLNGKSAKEIWERDELKINLCKEKGIKLITIWEYDWRNNKDEIVREINKILPQ